MSVSAHLAVQRNAFSTAAAAAKVCDGSTSSSIAERSSFATVYTSSQGKQLFCLVPNISNHVFSYQWKQPPQQGANASPLDPNNDGTWAATVHGLKQVMEIDPAAGDTAMADADKESTTTATGTGLKIVADMIKADTAPDQYRLVSAAMRLSCVNAADSNNGWFEAIRISPSWTVNGFMTKKETSTTANNGVILPHVIRFEDGVLLSANWANDPSYVTGRLRDLGKHTFYLQPNGQRNWHRWPKSANYKSFDDFVEQPFGFDPNFDIIAVRIFSTASETATLQQSIHCHVCKNWESKYDSKSPMARFETSTLSAKRAVEYADKQMTRDPKASMIRSASSYSYRY